MDFEEFKEQFAEDVKNDLEGKGIDRNEQREGKACVPRKAIACTSNKLEIPDYSEGFDKLYFVSISENGYKIDEWRSE